MYPPPQGYPVYYPNQVPMQCYYYQPHPGNQVMNHQMPVVPMTHQIVPQQQTTKMPYNFGMKNDYKLEASLWSRTMKFENNRQVFAENVTDKNAFGNALDKVFKM